SGRTLSLVPGYKSMAAPAPSEFLQQPRNGLRKYSAQPQSEKAMWTRRKFLDQAGDDGVHAMGQPLSA
ncbi:MAG: hypothetical protein MZV70_13930, partial [Desulfobacterales bacterium]|nr:hypothetical protein [Desulfobacterales bacterium]